MGAKQIQIFNDSQLVVHQVNYDFTAKDISMTAYLQHTCHLHKHHLSVPLITALRGWTPSFSSCKTKHYMLILLKHFAIAPPDT
ncbi:unnamed protein product [Prunus armeniaca]